MENGRVCSNLFGIDQQQVKRIVIDECLGCKEVIYKDDEVLKHPDGLLHDEIDCLVDYIREISLSTTA